MNHQVRAVSGRNHIGHRGYGRVDNPAAMLTKVYVDGFNQPLPGTSQARVLRRRGSPGKIRLLNNPAERRATNGSL
jgi:hypothetical protein